MNIQVDEHDQGLIDEAFAKMEETFTKAHNPSAAMKKVASKAMQYRNKGRIAAKKRHPFAGICEASGLPLEPYDAHLDELTPMGYAGDVRWVCPKANNSGKKSCGKC